MTDQDFYNGRWAQFVYINKTKLLRGIKMLDAIASIPIHEPRILDLGCGSGWFSSILGTIGPTTGVDLSDQAIFQATKRYPQVSFIQADFAHDDISDLFKERFDIVIAQEVIEHIDDQERFVRLAANMLKPNGYFILTTPNRIACELQPAEVVAAYENQPIEKWLSVRDVRKLTQPYFNVIQCKTFIHNSMLSQSFTAFYLFVRKLFRILYLGNFFDWIVFTAGLGLHICVVARKKLNDE